MEGRRDEREQLEVGTMPGCLVETLQDFHVSNGTHHDLPQPLSPLYIKCSITVLTDFLPV